MNTVLNAQQVRQSELNWAENKGVSTWPLMLRAGKSFVRQYLDQLRHKSVLVLVGRGNNGGDGYCIARLLREAGVRVVLAAPFGQPQPETDARRARQEFLDSGEEILDQWPEQWFEVLVDALFGSGLNRPLDDAAQSLIERMNASSASILAVDVPSGLNADTGLPVPVSVHADATHSFIAYKPGLLTAGGPGSCGVLTLDSLGVPTTGDWMYQPLLSGLPERSGNTHKARHGLVRIVGGRQGMGGASIIAASAALSAGAGRVISHCDAEFVSATLSHCPEIMTQPGLPGDGTTGSVWVVGPGLGRDREARDQVLHRLAQPDSTGVLDADALHLLPEERFDLNGWVLTPHEGEAAKLLRQDSASVQADRPKAALELSRCYQTVVVLKGSGTLVASADKLWFCHPGDPAMSTPGMGDSLAGIIGALLAQGLTAEQAAVTAVNWHARLGAELAAKQRLVFASDIIGLLKTR